MVAAGVLLCANVVPDDAAMLTMTVKAAIDAESALKVFAFTDTFISLSLQTYPFQNH